MIPRRAIYIAIGLLALIFLISEYTKDENPFPSIPAVEDAALKEAYPKLFEGIAHRDASAIYSFTRHSNKAVQNLAWQALGSTPVDNLDRFIERAYQSDNPLAWFGLSLHKLTDSQLRKVESYWQESTQQRSGISLVLGEQGDEQSLKFLMNHFKEAAGSSYEFHYALALGRLMRSFGLSETDETAILERAFEVENPTLTRAYLYGYYRGSSRKMSSELESEMYQLWHSYGIGTSTQVDQYVARIIPQLSLYETALYYNSENELENDIQLGVELSQALNDVVFDDRIQLVASILLHHPNPHVVQQALVNLTGHINKENNIYRFITEELLPNPRTNQFVWVAALKSVAETDVALLDEYNKRLKSIAHENPYLLPQVLRIRQVKDSPGDYLNRIAEIVGSGKTLRASFAVAALGKYWSSLPPAQKDAPNITNVRSIIFAALQLGDRGVTYATENILKDKSLFGASDFNTINNALSNFRLPQDIEVYQAFGRLYKEGFEQQGKPVIDSLAAKGYGPLNRSLADAGWDVEVADDFTATFRTPDWNTFWKLGKHPVWVLQTNKGLIKVTMDPLSAPATVSAIDSLTRAGAYNGVPFHRVVPNFVIQGGDIERGDGLGGPEFVIPTESSNQEFTRGAAGIASAGNDTEGSQYFFMHQWKPHLDGRYTLFGNVTEGMDVVDKIVVGDSVQVAYWQ